MNRRTFVATLASASTALRMPRAFSLPLAPLPKGDPRPGNLDHAAAAFPAGDYTPFGYLDNPWHTWNMHQSGVLRSLPGMGFALYYPAGPGGYFDFQRNEIYTAELSLGFRIGQKRVYLPEEFAARQLISTYHSKNVLTLDFKGEGVQIASSFFLVNEDALGVRIRLSVTDGIPKDMSVLAAHAYQLGGSQWWGGDGIAGDYAAAADSLWLRSFAGGIVFAVRGDRPSSQHFFSNHKADCETWLSPDASTGDKLSYNNDPLYGALRYDIGLNAHGQEELTIVMSRGANLEAALRGAQSSLSMAGRELSARYSEDTAFWRAAPQLTGDWPLSWQHGWVYDIETLRMMVRRPIGVYKHPWDAMQIQAPRNVLAETSIDMWALSYANPEVAKDVFLGQFLDALGDNVPCAREDGTMNMVATDGSECGTAISWCFPFFCAASIYDRTHDIAWLRRLYPRLAALLRWNLKNRVDKRGYIVGKCSWETGMDTSRRFQIKQPTGGELVEFLPLVELQAAASQAGNILARFAAIVGDDQNTQGWQAIATRYARKTQELWKDDWFHDFDNRTMALVTGVARDPSQAAPAFCGIATADQMARMRSTLHAMHASLMAQAAEGTSSADNPLNWSSFVLPYLEALWNMGERQLAAATVELICNRIYSSMDRRSIDKPGSQAGKSLRLGWPGVSCEVWGPQGAFGGEGYGWGAVMPAHIVRNLIGFRETAEPDHVILAPAFGSSLAQRGRSFGIINLPYAGYSLGIAFTFLSDTRLNAQIELPPSRRIQEVVDADGHWLDLRRTDSHTEFTADNFGRYKLVLS